MGEAGPGRLLPRIKGIYMKEEEREIVRKTEKEAENGCLAEEDLGEKFNSLALGTIPLSSLEQWP